MKAEEWEILERAMRQLIANISDLLKRIEGAECETDDDRCFQGLLTGILRAAMKDHQHLELGLTKSVYLAAWATRNMLELEVIAKYVVATTENARDFRNDFILDQKEFAEALTAQHEMMHKTLLAELKEMAETTAKDDQFINKIAEMQSKEGPKTQETEKLATAAKNLMSQHGIADRARPKFSSKIAELIGEHEAFKPMFKICSKIMHRTALSIASSNHEKSLDEIRPFLFGSALTELTEIYSVINDYVQKNGVRLPSA